jgi:GxxExxY protein
VGRVVKELLDTLTREVIGAAIHVHRELGPGLLESAYETCLAFELTERGFAVERQKALPLVYRGKTLNCGYRLDLLVEREVVVEIETVEHFDPVHVAQVLGYLRLSGCRIGLLINFNVKWLTRDGLRRLVNNFPE